MDNQLSCGHGSMFTGSRVMDDDTVGVIAPSPGVASE